jgi:hypothetical protein
MNPGQFPGGPPPNGSQRFMHKAVGTAATVWIVLALVPIALVMLCCGGFVVMGILGNVAANASP